MVKIIVPSVGESVSEATIAKWYKKVGDHIEIDELLLELETDKVTLEVNAQNAGKLDSIYKKEGENVQVGDNLGEIKEGVAGAKKYSIENKVETNIAVKPPEAKQNKLAPSVRKIVVENNLDTTSISGTGKDGRITKGDALESMSAQKKYSSDRVLNNKQNTTRVRMTRLRKTIASRLKDAQNNAAILTTFNEFDMSNIIKIRKKYQASFMKKHDVKLGFMSFFVKASISALREIPAINAEIEGDDEILYKNYYNIGVAVSTTQGLVVPVIQNAANLSLAGIELAISSLAQKARDGKLTIPDMSGGTFSITNGGVYGSLLSTPIINPPQSGILGLHKIQERPMAIDGKIEIRPMMYAALSYDHRIIDGQEAVTFLVKIKQYIENPETLLLEL